MPLPRASILVPVYFYIIIVRGGYVSVNRHTGNVSVRVNPLYMIASSFLIQRGYRTHSVTSRAGEAVQKSFSPNIRVTERITRVTLRRGRAITALGPGCNATTTFMSITSLEAVLMLARGDARASSLSCASKLARRRGRHCQVVQRRRWPGSSHRGCGSAAAWVRRLWAGRRPGSMLRIWCPSRGGSRMR
jgi:hypothetical protein